MTDKCSAVAEMGDRLATIDIGRKLAGRCAPHFFFGGGELGPHLTQCRLGRCLPPYQVVMGICEISLQNMSLTHNVPNDNLSF